MYDVELKAFDDILEGFIIASVDVIDKESNDIKYVKDYINELITFYKGIMDDEEKCNLRKRVVSLLDLVSDYALDTPKIIDVYAYVLFILIENDIMEIKYLQNIFTENNKDIIKDLNMILGNLCQYNKSDAFKKELSKIGFIVQNKGAFECVFDKRKNG